MSLAFGYNGLERLLGRNWSIAQPLSSLSPGPAAGADGIRTAGGFGGGLFNNGPVGPLRLLDQKLAGQSSWLLLLALFSIAAGAWRAFADRGGFLRSARGQVTLVFGAWLVTAGAFFSVASFFHSYYLVTLGPPIAALAAIGVVEAWAAFRSGSRAAWFVPAVLVGAALVQAHILGAYPSWSAWMSPIALGGAVLGSAVLVFALVRGRTAGALATPAMGLAVAALLIAPAVWSADSVLRGAAFGLPAAGPSPAQVGGRFGGGGGSRPARTPGGGFAGAATPALVGYLEANQGQASYMLATTDSNTAASFILASGQPVMSIGGFSGSDPIVTVDQFANMVRSGEVRYVLVGRGNTSIGSWVASNGTRVSSDALGGSQVQLYDLGGLRG
jgi:4-amino-4-deoxy-L-arabinose transferase-like glycosyltransferase